MQKKKTDGLSTPQSDLNPRDVMPLFGNNTSSDKANKIKVSHDILMLGLLMIDLTLIFVDGVLMSALIANIATWVGFDTTLHTYYTQHHEALATIGGVFTLFWITELTVRWIIAIVNHTYHRWFFFPFVHWYEVLACFPALRALRLLRAVVIIKRLHKIGIKVIPQSWVKSARFYCGVILEELSDRVILTAINNIREQIKGSKPHEKLIQDAINKNRIVFENAILEILRAELSPKLSLAFHGQMADQLSSDISLAVEQALIDTPELKKYLKLVPVAGNLIENQITAIGKNMAKNITISINSHLFHEKTLDALMVQIAKGVANVDTNHPALQELISRAAEDMLNAFEQQIKIQQWKHTEQIKSAMSEH